MAPEMVLGLDYDSKVDVFSFSMMMFEMLTGKFNPYKGTEGSFDRFIEFKVANNPHFRPNLQLLPTGVPNFFCGLLKRCWDHKPQNRLSFQEISEILTSETDTIGGMVVYVRYGREADDEAEDLFLRRKSIASLQQVLLEHYKKDIISDELLKITSGGREIAADSDVQELEDDCMIIISRMAVSQEQASPEEEGREGKESAVHQQDPMGVVGVQRAEEAWKKERRSLEEEITKLKKQLTSADGLTEEIGGLKLELQKEKARCAALVAENESLSL